MTDSYNTLWPVAISKSAAIEAIKQFQKKNAKPVTEIDEKDLLTPQGVQNFLQALKNSHTITIIIDGSISSSVNHSNDLLAFIDSCCANQKGSESIILFSTASKRKAEKAEAASIPKLDYLNYLKK